MPWSPQDAERHTKRAQTTAQREQWAAVANSVLERGGSDGSAIRQANSVVRRRTLADANRPRKSKE